MRFDNFEEFANLLATSSNKIFNNNELIQAIYYLNLKTVNKITKDNENAEYILHDIFNNIDYYLNIDNKISTVTIKTKDMSLNNQKAKFMNFSNKIFINIYYENDNLIIEKLSIKNGLNINAKFYNQDTINYLTNLKNINLENLENSILFEKIGSDFEINSYIDKTSEIISTKLYRNGLLFEEYNDITSVSNTFTNGYIKYRNLLEGYDNRSNICKILKLNK